MSKPLRQPGDGAKAAKRYLATVLPALVDEADLTVTLGLPPDWTPKAAPVLVVFDDGGPSVWPVVTQPTIRVTAWADGRDRARRIAGVALGVLLAHRIDGLVVAPDPTALLDDRDPATGGVLASATVPATVRTVPVQ